MKKFALLSLCCILICGMFLSCKRIALTQETGNSANENDKYPIAENPLPDRHQGEINSFDHYCEAYLNAHTGDIAVYKDQVYSYLADGINQVTRMPIDGGHYSEAEIICQFDSKITALALDDEKLYICDADNDQLVEMTLEGEIQQRYLLNQNSFSHMDVCGGQAALGDDSGSIWLYNFADNDPDKIIKLTFKGLYGIREITYLDENTLMLMVTATGDKYDLYTYAIAEQQLNHLHSTERGGAYDCNMGNTYFMERVSVVNLTDNGNITTLHHVIGNMGKKATQFYCPRKLFVTETNIFYWSLLNDRFVTEPLATGESVVYFAPYGTSKNTEIMTMAREYQKKYNRKLEIQEHASEGSYLEKLNLKLLAGDTDFDLFYQDAGLVSFASVLKQGAYEPLNNYPAIMESITEMTNGMQELLTYEGNIFGLPRGILYEFWYLTAEGKQMLDTPLAINWSVEDIFAACEELLAKNNGYSLFVQSNVVYNNLLRQICFGFCMEEFDPFNGTHTKDAQQNLTDLLEKLHGYYTRGVLVGEKGLIRQISHGQMIGMSYPNDADPLMVPSYSDGGKAPIIFTGINMINPNSPRKQAAADYLAMWISEDYRYTAMNVPIFPDTDRYTGDTGHPLFSRQEAVQKLLAQMDKIYTGSRIRMGVVAISQDDIMGISAGTLTPAEAAKKYYQQVSYEICE